MLSKTQIRLGVNIDHVATVRNARGGRYPDPLCAALIAQQVGADGITVHLREDRRHITDQDVAVLIEHLTIPLNLEMAATREMQTICLAQKLCAVCLVPEKRQERTTEGGINVVDQSNYLSDFIKPLQNQGCRVSLFIDPEPAQIETAAAIGADVIELHTGAYAEACALEKPEQIAMALNDLSTAALLADSCNLEVHAGHGLTYANVQAVAKIPPIQELNIGHFLISEAIFMGLKESIAKMRKLIDSARS